MKVVVDTMLWVSYCTSKDGYRHRLINLARRKRVRFFVSEYILDELTRTLVEDLGLSRRYAWLARRAVLRVADLVDLPAVVARYVILDPADDSIVQTALVARADYLVTADTDILGLREPQEIKIITPAQFEERLTELG